MSKRLYPPKPKNQNSDCPSCGFHISYATSFESVLAGNFDNSRDGSYVATRSTPIRASTLEADVLVPAAQSLIWAVVSSVPAVAISFWLRYEWYFPLAVAGVSMAFSWSSSMKRSDMSCSKVEEFEYSPSPDKNDSPAPGAGGEAIRLEVINKSDDMSAAMKIVDLPEGIEPVQFLGLCKDALAGKGLARKNWTGSGKEFSRDQYDGLMTAMVSSGLVMTVPGKGKMLTLGGRKSIKRMIRQA